MQGVKFPQQTVNFGKPEDWKDEDCYGLPVNQGYYLNSAGDKVPCLISCWELSTEELTEIQKTGRIYLSITGLGMPPVSLQVDNPCPEDLQPGIDLHEWYKTGKA